MAEKEYLVKGSTLWVCYKTFLNAQHWMHPQKNLIAAKKLIKAIERKKLPSCNTKYSLRRRQHRVAGHPCTTDRVIFTDAEGTGQQDCAKKDKNIVTKKKSKTNPSHKEKPQCSTCGKTFSTKGYLKIHARTHTGERPYSCNLCDFSCSQKSYLNVHLRLHSKERPHVCTHCSSAFKTSRCLKKHLLIHNGEKSHKCDFCGKGFNQRCNLKIHLRQHTGEKPFCCNVCNRSFRQQQHLKHHKCDPNWTNWRREKGWTIGTVVLGQNGALHALTYTLPC